MDALTVGSGLFMREGAEFGEAVLSNPSAFKAEEIRTLRDQITSNLERAWDIMAL